MYERLGELWKQYCTKYSGEWVGDDPRHDLSAEVRERLTQLDLVLEHLSGHSPLLPSIQSERNAMLNGLQKLSRAWHAGNYSGIIRGIVINVTSGGPRGYVQHEGEVRLFTEYFYFVSGRF